jgi:PIN domain nuclease of toxin-antitoxin system
VVNLLDTSTLLWTLAAPDRLSQTAREAIAAGDPFDRVLIAQAVAEGLPLVTSDRQIGAYPVRVVW